MIRMQKVSFANRIIQSLHLWSAYISFPSSMVKMISVGEGAVQIVTGDGRLR
jgi:hypothetical protein